MESPSCCFLRKCNLERVSWKTGSWITIVDRLGIGQRIPDQHVATLIKQRESGDDSPVCTRRSEHDRRSISGRSTACRIAGRWTCDGLPLRGIPIDGIRNQEHAGISRGVDFRSIRSKMARVSGIQRNCQASWLGVRRRPEDVVDELIA